MPRGSTTSTYRRTNYRRTQPALTPPEEFLENPQRITATLARMLEVGERDEHSLPNRSLTAIAARWLDCANGGYLRLSSGAGRAVRCGARFGA
jgi:hypothetical protein